MAEDTWKSVKLDHLEEEYPSSGIIGEIHTRGHLLGRKQGGIKESVEVNRRAIFGE